MAGELIQLGGNLKLGPFGGGLVDWSNFVSQFKVNVARKTVTKPATLGDPVETELASVRKGDLLISFFSSVDASSIWSSFYDIIMTDTAKFDWSGNWNPGATTTDNRRYFGTATLTSLSSGNTVGELRNNEVTCPLVSWQFVTA